MNVYYDEACRSEGMLEKLEKTGSVHRFGVSEFREVRTSKDGNRNHLTGEAHFTFRSHNKDFHLWVALNHHCSGAT